MAQRDSAQQVERGQIVALEGTDHYGIVISTEPVVRVVDLGPARQHDIGTEPI